MTSNTGLTVFKQRPPKISLPIYEEHAGQKEVSQVLRENFLSATPAAIAFIAAGRGWGKTLYVVCSILIPYLETNPNAKVMWVAPTYLHTMSVVDDIFKAVNEFTGEPFISEYDKDGNRRWEFVTTKSGSIIKWWNGAIVSFRSADAPESIVSKGYNLIIIDEASLIQEKVYQLQILGTARRKGVKIIMISSPRGKNHFTYGVYLKGQDPKEPMYVSFRQPYWKNPNYSPILIELMKEIPEWIRKQEYEAEFVDSGESIFRNVESVVDQSYAQIQFRKEDRVQEWTHPEYEESVPKNKSFILGADLAKQSDYTVFTIMDLDTGKVVYFKRFNKEDYKIVAQHIEALSKKFNSANCIYDATGVGVAFGDILNGHDVASTPFTFTNDTKNTLVSELALAIEYGTIQIPNIQTITNELSIFTYELTRTGKFSYGAPSGFHDDCVMSLALANLYRKENGGSNEVISITEEFKRNNEPTKTRSKEDDISRMFGDDDDDNY